MSNFKIDKRLLSILSVEELNENFNLLRDEFNRRGRTPNNTRSQIHSLPKNRPDGKPLIRPVFLARPKATPIPITIHDSDSESDDDESQTQAKRIRVEQSQEMNCPVCYTTIQELRENNKLAVTSCGHFVCRDCVLTILQDRSDAKCPICRSGINAMDGYIHWKI